MSPFSKKNLYGGEVLTMGYSSMIVSLVGVLLIIIFPMYGQGSNTSECDGPYKAKKMTYEKLRHVLEAHEQWEKTRQQNKPAGQYANLCQAVLRGITLDGINLAEANLAGADLTNASLSKANLVRSDLSNAMLTRANLRGTNLAGAIMPEASLAGADLTSSTLDGSKLFKAILSRANMTRASLAGTDLREAHLFQTNLYQASLAGAMLNGSILRETNLREVDIRRSDLASAIFEPQPGTLPNTIYIALASNLSKMTFEASPHGLNELREAFKKAGMRKEERAITYAIKHTQRRKDWQGGIANKAESLFNLFLFELTCNYGMSPGRPLLLLVVSIIAPFMCCYIYALIKADKRSGIWATLIANKMNKHIGVRLERPFFLKKDGGAQADCKLLFRLLFILNWLHLVHFDRCLASQTAANVTSWFRILRISLYFSILSAFRIGWRELNVGNWITRIQKRNYSLSATGWVRSASGIQSLLSVYWLALYVLTYFTRPFE